MSSEAFSDDFVRAVAAGIREYNRAAPPGPMIVFKNGKQQPLSPADKKINDDSWTEAVRFGLKRAAPFLVLDREPGEEA